MRRFVIAAAVFLAASAVLAAGPYYLARNGILWKGASSPDGLVLTGEQAGEEIVRQTIPFTLGVGGSSDTEIQVAADEVSGKVALVWQRNWSEGYSDIMLAVWSEGTWERIDVLSDDVQGNPRNPVIEMTQAASQEADPADPESTVTVRDSFLSALWWQGQGEGQQARLAVLRLTATDEEPAPLTRTVLEGLGSVGLACDAPTPADVLDHPLFASQPDISRALAFYASAGSCTVNMLEIRFVLDRIPDEGGTVIGQRGRHRPVFGVRKSYPSPLDFRMASARAVVGPDLNPVLYKVRDGHLEYTLAGRGGWTAVRTLEVKPDLTMDQAIPLVESLAR